VPRVVYGIPAVPVAPVDSHGQALELTWTGADGSVWNLTDPRSPVFLTEGEIVGLDVGPADRFVSNAPGVAGSRHRGSRTLERPVVFTVHVWSDAGPQAWTQLDAAFRRSLSRNVPGVLAVKQPWSNEVRTLECRFVDRTGSNPTNPTQSGWDTYELRLVANDPYWRGKPIVRPFQAGTAVPFIPPGGGPPFTISEGSLLASASIPNPGDVIGWAEWTVEGATTGVTVGIGDQLVGIPAALDAGDVVVVDTDPRRQSATLNGVRVRGFLSPHDFAPIPAGATVPLAVSIVGTGKVSVRLVPRYEAAW
jgi:hypothetical protein